MTKHIAKNFVLLLILSLLWAGTFIFVKIADQSLSPLTIMAFRGLISTLFLFIALPITGKPLLRHFRNGRLQLVCVCSGLLIAYMWLTIAYSEKTLSAAMASLLLTALVPFTWLIATFITKEKPFYIINALGILIATLGIIIMIGIKHIMHADHTLWAALLYISGLASFAAAATINKTFARHTAPQTTISFNLLYMSIILSITALLFGHPLAEHFTHRNIAALCALSICSTGIGYLIYFYLSHHAGLVFAAMSSYLVPIMGFGMGLFLLHEIVHSQQLIGLLVVFIGMWLIQKKLAIAPA
jgi:drug/metabolite transporter (DMT)-like permease